MKNITEKKLIELGFEKQDVTEKDACGDNPFYYFTYEIGSICLISNSNDECIKGKYCVGLFDHPDIGDFYDYKTVFFLITAFKCAKKIADRIVV